MHRRRHLKELPAILEQIVADISCQRVCHCHNAMLSCQLHAGRSPNCTGMSPRRSARSKLQFLCDSRYCAQKLPMDIACSGWFPVTTEKFAQSVLSVSVPPGDVQAGRQPDQHSPGRVPKGVSIWTSCAQSLWCVLTSSMVA